MSGVIVPFDDINASDSLGEWRLAMDKMLVEYVDPIDGKIYTAWFEDLIDLEELIAVFIEIGSGAILSINGV